MNLTSLALRSTLLSMMLLLASPAFAALKTGDTLALPVLEDQFEEKQSLKESTQWLLFCHDMDSTKIIRGALEGQTAEKLNEKSIQVYADISGMPGFVRRFIAMPKLKDLAYPMALALDEELLEFMPREEDKATVLEIEKGNIKSITIVDSQEKLKEQLAE